MRYDVAFTYEETPGVAVGGAEDWLGGVFKGDLVSEFADAAREALDFAVRSRGRK